MMTIEPERRGRVNQAPGPEERRRSQARFTWTDKDALAVIVTDGQQSRWARARDISRNGIGLSVCCALKPGTTLSIHLRSWSTLRATERIADVVYTRPQGDGT